MPSWCGQVKTLSFVLLFTHYCNQYKTGREVYLSTLSNEEFMSVWSCNSTPSVCLHNIDKAKFASFYLLLRSPCKVPDSFVRFQINLNCSRRFPAQMNSQYQIMKIRPVGDVFITGGRTRQSYYALFETSQYLRKVRRVSS